MSTTRPAVVSRPPRTRSAISNGSLLPRDIDGRSSAARRYTDLVIAFEADLGGFDNLSEAERSMVRQAAGATLAAEQMQFSVIRGDDVDFEQLTRASNVAARLLQRLRLRQRPAKRKSIRDRLLDREAA